MQKRAFIRARFLNAKARFRPCALLGKQKSALLMKMVFVLVAMLTGVSVQAGLGERGRKIVSPIEPYSVHTVESGGNSVREYLSSDGTVFAVAWEGLSSPDLSQLFGDYYVEYAETLKKERKRKGRAPREIQASHIVVRHFGHMHAVRGVAYIPSLIPAGITPDEIK
jgi:hypothetical protein